MSAAATQHPTKVFKILGAAGWQAWQQTGTFRGASIDLTDGYIHLSTAAQSEETFEKYFAGQTGLVVAEVDLSKVTESPVRWEASREARCSPTSMAPSRRPPSCGSSRRSTGRCLTSSWRRSSLDLVVPRKQRGLLTASVHGAVHYQSQRHRILRYLSLSMYS
ncbi:hypothetical protein PG994_009595 [Apiospora phragmitis]|uniref:DUF952 domain-containing protein n=1 Tax=Apiospora phragmitis TaxID=2905665 RepID=A0ABR1U991_9PEZI